MRRLLARNFLLPLGLVLFVSGAKLALIHFNASDQPFSDQWSAEGGAVFRWRLGGAFEFAHYFYPHGEHTPALTRIAATGVALANADQWDSRVEMLVTVGAHALCALLLWQLIAAALPKRWQWPAAALVAVLLALPGNSENFLWGFQTQFLFLILFGLAHLLGTLREERVGASWWLAQVCGLFGLFSIASGMLSAATLAAFAVLRLWQAPRSRWAWATALVNAGLFALGLWILTRAYFAVERTAGVSTVFVTALGHLLAWPLPGPWLALLTQLPVLFLFWKTRTRWLEAPVRLVLALGLWCWLLAAAFAFGRGTGAGEIAVRYQDPLTIGLIANALAAAFVLSHRATRRFMFAGALWFTTIVASLVSANRPATLRSNLAGPREFFVRQERVLNDYLATNDAAVLERDPLIRQFFPHFEQTRDLLADPISRTAMPPSFAPTVAIQSDPTLSSAGTTFRRDEKIRHANNARVLALNGSSRGATFVSQPIADDLRPIWRVRVNGRVGQGGAELFLRDANGREVFPLDGEFDTAGQWKTVNFLRGSGAVRLVARVPAGAEMSVTEPVELGWLSWLAPKIAGAWAWLLAGGALLLALAAFRPAQPSGGRRAN